MDIKIADPAALGLVGFGMTTCILSLVNMGIIGGSGLGVVLALAVAYGGGAQLVAGLWEFRKGNTFGATAFFSLEPGAHVLVPQETPHIIRNTGETRLYVLTTMVPDEQFSKLIKSGIQVTLDEDDLRILRGGR